MFGILPHNVFLLLPLNKLLFCTKRGIIYNNMFFGGHTDGQTEFDTYDLYEPTMMQGYFKSKNDKTVVFDMFYRTNPSGGGYAIAAGLEQVIQYIKELKFEKEDIDYLANLGIFEQDFQWLLYLFFCLFVWLLHPNGYAKIITIGVPTYGCRLFFG